LGPRGSPGYVQGWKIAERGDSWIRVEAACWYASAEAVVLIDDEHVMVSLSLRYDHPLVGALVWSLISGPHQRAVPIMLRQADKLVRTGSECDDVHG
jgi:hypothetical protein